MAAGIDSLEQGLTDRPRIWVWLVFVAGVGVIGAYQYALNAYMLLDASQGPSDVALDVFGKYLAIVVVMERLADVFVSMFRDQSRIDWSRRISSINKVLEQENATVEKLKNAFERERRQIEQLKQRNIIVSIDDVPEKPSKDDYRGYLLAAKHAYEYERTEFNSDSNRYVALAVFVAGIILATLGPSLFQEMFQQTQALSAGQAGLLRVVDIFITGGLLGGGSASLNAVFTKVSDHMNTK